MKSLRQNKTLQRIFTRYSIRAFILAAMLTIIFVLLSCYTVSINTKRKVLS